MTVQLFCGTSDLTFCTGGLMHGGPRLKQHTPNLRFVKALKAIRLICGLILLVFIVCVLSWAWSLTAWHWSPQGPETVQSNAKAYLEDLREARELEEAPPYGGFALQSLRSSVTVVSPSARRGQEAWSSDAVSPSRTGLSDRARMPLSLLASIMAAFQGRARHLNVFTFRFRQRLCGRRAWQTVQACGAERLLQSGTCTGAPRVSSFNASQQVYEITTLPFVGAFFDWPEA